MGKDQSCRETVPVGFSWDSMLTQKTTGDKAWTSPDTFQANFNALIQIHLCCKHPWGAGIKVWPWLVHHEILIKTICSQRIHVKLRSGVLKLNVKRVKQHRFVGRDERKSADIPSWSSHQNPERNSESRGGCGGLGGVGGYFTVYKLGCSPKSTMLLICLSLLIVHAAVPAVCCVLIPFAVQIFQSLTMWVLLCWHCWSSVFVLSHLLS